MDGEIRRFESGGCMVHIASWAGKSGRYHALVRVDGSPMVDMVVDYQGGNLRTEVSCKGLDKDGMVWVGRLSLALHEVERLNAVFEQNVKWARVLAASNCGLDYTAYDSVAWMTTVWAQGIDESGSGLDPDAVMDAEVNGFLEAVLGLEALPEYWRHIEQAVKEMEND
jgi:hypothetical protein